MEIKERHDWTIVLSDEFRKEDVAWSFATKEEAEAKVTSLVKHKFCTRKGEPEIEVPEWP